MSGIITNTQGCLRAASGLGDSTLSLWYEALEDASPWRIKTLKDMVPSVNIGPSLLIPLGISPYDDVESSFDVCGRGFYRIDGNVLIEKTIQPWNLSLLFSYGKYIERPVNREYGKYVEPYDKAPGGPYIRHRLPQLRVLYRLRRRHSDRLAVLCLSS